MAGSPGQGEEVGLKIRPEAPGSAAAQAVLTAYFREIVGRRHRRAATDAEVAAAMCAEPSDDLCPPGGLLLLAWQDGTIPARLPIRRRLDIPALTPSSIPMPTQWAASGRLPRSP